MGLASVQRRSTPSREALERLLNDRLSLFGSSPQGSRVNRKTAKRWRNNRVIRYPGGRAVHYPPVINAPTVKTYSTRYLGEGSEFDSPTYVARGRTIQHRHADGTGAVDDQPR